MIRKKKNNNNNDIKTLKDKNIIKESNDSLLRNYWNKTKYIWLNIREIKEKDWLHSKK